MSSASTTPVSPLQAHHIRNLILILRHANTHYRAVAAHIRASLHPTQHARNHARRLGLQVNINKAVRCDQKQVSVVPLPILDTSYTPVAATGPSVSLSGIAYELRSIPSQSSLKRRPALKCAIPGVVTRTTPNGTTSAINPPSSMSDYSAVSLSSPIYQAILGSKLVTSMWSADGEDVAESFSSDVSMDVPISIPIGPSMQAWQPLDVPIDEEEMDWGFDDISDMDVSSPASSGSGSDTTSSTDSSAGPTTPVSSCVPLSNLPVAHKLSGR